MGDCQAGEARGARLRSLDGTPIDMPTSTGRLLLYSMLGALAEFERDVLRERTKDGLRAAQKRGARLGAPRSRRPPWTACELASTDANPCAGCGLARSVGGCAMVGVNLGRPHLDERLAEGALMPFPKGFDPEFFLRELDKRPELVGCRVVYFDDAVMTTLRVGPLMSSVDLMAVVVRKGGPELLPTAAEVQRVKDERFHAELLNLGLSCGGVLLSWVAAAVSTGAAPITGGLSLVITTATTAASYAGYAQCAVALYRTGAEFYDPQVNVAMDNNEVYQLLSTASDIIGLAGVAATGASTLRAIQLMKRATGKPLVDIIKGLSRQERKRLTEEILRSQNPGLSNTKLKLMQLAKQAPKRYAGGAISAGIRQQLLEVVGAMGNVAGSATGGVISQTVSGGTNEDYIVGLARAYETQ